MASAVALTLLAVSTVGTVVSGFQKNKAAKAEASLLEEQGQIARDEADAEASRVAEANSKFIKRQKLAFLKNGVSLAGSPLLILDESQAESAKQVAAIQKSGQSQQTLAQRKAKITKSAGRAALVGSVFQAGGQAASGFVAGKEAGLFGGDE